MTLGFETNPWIIQVPEPYPVVVFLLTFGFSWIKTLCVFSWFMDWYHSDFSFLPPIFPPSKYPTKLVLSMFWADISLVCFFWKTLGFSRSHAGTKTMQECDHIIQTKTGHFEVTGRQDVKMMLIFLNTWDSLSQANNMNQYYHVIHEY